MTKRSRRMSRMIEKDIRQGDREKALLAALNKIRVKLNEGGNAKPPIDLDEYLKLGLSLSQLSDQEREAIKYMLDNVFGKDKK